VAEAKWYVVHTYSGYENKVKANIEKAVENRRLEDRILEASVPMESVQETKNGKTRMVQKKLLPGYVLVNMVMDDETWYVVRNTRGVTGFVGPGSKPVPLKDSEIRNLGLGGAAEGEEAPAVKPRIVVDFEPGDYVEIVSGAWKGIAGAVKSVNPHKQMVTVNVDLFGRDTPLELGFAEVKKK